RPGQDQVRRVGQRRSGSVISANAGVLQHVRQLQEARLVGNREHGGGLLDGLAASGRDRLHQRVDVQLLVLRDRRSQFLGLAAEPYGRRLVLVEIGLQILERQGKVQDVEVAA